jgi:hypothetical protein
MILTASTPNDDDTPNATVGTNAFAVMTVASAMSRNAALLSSTWTAVQCTSSADADPSSSPWPSSLLFSLGGVLLVVVVRPLCCHCHCHCRIELQSDLIAVLVLPPPMRIAFCNCYVIRVVPPPIRRRPLLLFNWSGQSRPTSSRGDRPPLSLGSLD